MPFKFEEIQREWFGGPYLHLDTQEVERAFDLAEGIRGREWVLGPRVDFDFAGLPGVGRRGGFMEFLRVYWFGRRAMEFMGAPGAELLLAKLVANDPSASSEATAVFLLRSGHPDTDLELGPEVKVGDHNRRPDFNIRKKGRTWVYTEVTQLNSSMASERMSDLLDRVAGKVIAIQKPFLFEIVFWREPTTTDEDQVVAAAHAACVASDGHRVDIENFASVLVKSGEASVLVPSILPADDVTRMSRSRSVVGPGAPNRQILLRAPFADERAEDVLTAEAKQLPKGECGLIMVDVARQPTAFESWGKLVPDRFTPKLHTRVAGVILFMFAVQPTAAGLSWLPHVKLISNPHARVPLPAWITDKVASLREECRRFTARPD